VRRRLLIVLGVVIGLLCGGGVNFYLRARAAFLKIEIVDPGVTGVRVHEDGVFANYYPNKSNAAAPGVLLLGGSEGGLGQGAKDAATALQAEGYSVLTPAYFGAPGLPKRLELVPLETFDRALAWLAARPEVDSSRLGIGGVSKGAEAALLVATRHPELRAVVAGVPSSAVWPGIKWASLKTKSSWTVGRKPLPALPYGPFRLRMLFRDVGVVYRDGIKKFADHPASQIAIETIHAPVLLLCGEEDNLWPSCVMSRQLKARAAAEGGPAVTVLAYKDAGHLSVGPALTHDDPHVNDLSALGGSIAGNNAARAAGWQQILVFMRAQLTVSR
jgi:uncharacterized protein